MCIKQNVILISQPLTVVTPCHVVCLQALTLIRICVYV